MSGGSKTQTQTTTQQPYKAAQPLLDKGMGDALAHYNAGGLVKPNTMSTVVPYAKQTMSGLNNMEMLARREFDGPSFMGDAFRATGNMVRDGGYNNEQNQALSGIRDTATSQFDVNANPAFQQVLKQAQDSASNAVNNQAASLGRYNSGTHQGVMAREVGDLTARMVGDEYRNWQTRKDTAQQNLFNAGQTGQANVMNAAQFLPTAYQNQMLPAETLTQVGGMYEDLAGRQLNDQLRITNERQNAPLANIQALLAAASGAGSYGTRTQSAQMPNSGFSNAMGGLLGGASLLRGLF